MLGASVLAKEPQCFIQNGHEYALLRAFSAGDKLLLVNTKSLKTEIRELAKSMLFVRCTKESHYAKLKAEALTHPFSIANRGIIKGKQKVYALTVDMCPSSKKGFELDFFKSLVFRKKGYPVAISLTKQWALYHPKEFEQLKAWDDSKALNITWMNHGSMHPYTRGLALEKNFINQEGVDFKKEVLDNELFMIKEGRTPSIFYRFAGLVSNEKAYRYLIETLGLIPLGTKAWLAKGEKIKAGSIVLVHGNKNEPLGIKRFLEAKTELPVLELPQLFIED